MKKAYLILFTSLILILSCGGCVQANITQEYIEYTFNHFQNISGLGSYQGNANNILKTLTSSDYNFYTTYLNQVLKENELSKLKNINLITLFNSNANTVNIYFIFSNVSVPNGIDNLGYLKLSRTVNAGVLNFSCYGDDEDYIYYVKLNITSSSHNGFETVKKMNNSSTEVTSTYYLAYSSLNDENSVLTISNVACMQIQAIYYHVPFTTSGTTITYSGFIKGLYVSEDDPGYYISTSSGDTSDSETSGGDNGDSDTTGNTGDSGNTSGTTTTDLSKVETGITNINQNIDKTNEKLDEISGKIPTSGEIKDATKNGVINGNTSYWGDSEDLNGDNQETQIENGINDILADFSGDLGNNSIFKILEIAELGLIDILQGKPRRFQNHMVGRRI